MKIRPSPSSLGAAAWLLIAGSALAQSPDPFGPQRRWGHPASASSAWMPSSVDFAAHGELVWSSAVGANPRAMLFASGEIAPTTDLAPAREDTGFGTASGAIQTRSARDADALFSAAQYAVTDVAHRRTEIARYAPTASPFVPQWRHSLALIGNGSCRVAASRDGARVVAAAHDSASSLLDVEWLDGASGAMQTSVVLSSSTLRELAASSDVTRAALVAGTHVWLLDAAGATLFEQDLGQATSALGLSGDGRVLAFGFGPRVRVLTQQNSSFPLAFDAWGAPGEMPVRVALSDDGATLAIAWWNQISGTAARFQVWRNGALVFDRLEANATGSYQNLPTAVQVTPNGARALFAAWGHPSTAPELWLVDVTTGALAWSLDLPGSALAAALDDSGTRIAVGFKNAHANQFATTGEVRLYDTGERDLQVIGMPSLSGGLHLSTQLAGSTRAFFVLGQRLATPIPFAGSSGVLAIDRSHGGRIFVRRSVGNGRSDLSIPIPFAALGLDFAAQGAFRVNGNLRFTATVVEPVIF